MNASRNTLILALGIVAFLSLPGLALARSQGPCADDAAKLCKDVRPGHGRIARCLKQHQSELSDACKQDIATKKEKAKTLAAACKDDTAKLCSDVKRGRARVLKCLTRHENELSPACKEAMPTKR